MAEVDLHDLFKRLRGKIGGLVFRRLPHGSTVVSGVSSRNGPSLPSGRRRNTRSMPGWRRSGR
ncbi:MAG TPA: hypothetical protein VHO49_08905 [Anaerolineales bacterium]|nr:hypothetical protein [Anaerolineales bacterium]